MSRTVLVLAYHFPPVGGAGAQRVVQLTRRLGALGFRPIVVTGAGGANDRWAPLDHKLGRDLDRVAEVVRLAEPEPRTPSAWRVRRDRWLRRESRWERWWSEGVVHAATSTAGRIDLVHATVAPYPAASAVRRISRELQCPLVVDLEDPWALDEMMIQPTLLHRRLELRRMRRTLQLADAVVMNTPEAARRVRAAFPELRGRLVTAIPNAFDPDDFREPLPPRAGETFRIVHTGSLHTDFALRHRRTSPLRRLTGGGAPGVEYLTRSHVYLLDALARAARVRPEFVRRVELHLAGVLTEADRQALRDAPVTVESHGFLPHPDAIALMRSADLLLLPLHDVPQGTRVGLIPQKTYEYVAAGRPILAAVPPGDVRDLLEAVPTARLCRPADSEAMARVLLDELERWSRGVPPPAVPPAVVARHDARRLARDMARLYCDVLQRYATASHGTSGSRSPAGATRPRKVQSVA